MEPIKVGIVGYGYAGRNFHSYLVKLAQGLQLYAIATRDPERRARASAEQGVKTFATLDEMLEDPEVQLVIIATPHDTHKELAVKALRAGRHVVVDKVMCLTTAEADEMIAEARRNQRMLSVFQNRRWDGDYLTVKKAIETGLLGRPLVFETAVMRYGQPRGWRAVRAQMGGILFDWGAHLVDQALLLVPSKVVSVTGFSQFEQPDTDIESYARCQIRFENGVLYSVEVSNLAHLGKPRWLVLGDKGALVKEGLDPQEAAMNRGEIEKAREDPAYYARVRASLAGQTCDMVLTTLQGDWRKYYQNIANHLLQGEELAVKPEEVRRAVAVLEASKQSAETGLPVTFNPPL